MATPSTTTAPNMDVSVSRPTPYTFDLGLLLATDPNPLPDPASAALEERLAATARDGAQALINQLLTAVPLQSTPAGVLLTLPPVSTALPREKRLPTVKAKTKWQAFAERKGIKPKSREQNAAKAHKFNEATGQWERTWGYDKDGKITKRQDGAVPDDWIVEVDDKEKVPGQGGPNKKNKNSKNKRIKS